MKSFATRIDIQAPVGSIWRIITDLPCWPRWNSTVERTTGIVELDAKVTVFVKGSPGRAFAVRVTDINAPRSMTWVGSMPFGLFTGTRVFELTASPAADRAVFSMRETYGGPLSGVIGKSIPDLQPAFDEFAQCLKREAERR